MKFKNVLSYMLAMAAIVSFTPIQAESTINDSATIKVSRTTEEIARDEQVAFESIENYYNQLRVDEYVYKLEKVGTRSVTKKGIGFAGNQGTGVTFTTPGGFYWSDGGYNTNVSLSMNFGYGAVSFGVSVSAGKVGSSGAYISSPYLNRKCKLYIYKDLSVTQYKVYRKYKYDPDTSYSFYGYQYSSTTTNYYLEVRAV